MAKYEINITQDKAEKLIEELFNELEIKRCGSADEQEPFFIDTFRWLNPDLKDIVVNKTSMAKFLATVFTCAGATKEDIIKMVTNFYGFYDDSDLISDYRDEDEC